MTDIPPEVQRAESGRSVRCHRVPYQGKAPRERDRDKDVASVVKRVAFTPAECRELECRAQAETGGVLSTLIRKALGLKPRKVGRRAGCSCDVRLTTCEHGDQEGVQTGACGDPMCPGDH